MKNQTFSIVHKFSAICVFAVVLFLHAASCTSEKRASERKIEFSVLKELKGEVVHIDTAMFRYPFRIKVHKDRAIVLDLHNPDYYYHLFTYPYFVYLSSFGKRGEAPGEMLMAENIRFVEKEELEAWVLDSNKRRITRLGFNAARDSMKDIAVIPLSENLLRPLDFCIYQDTLIMIPDYSGENRFCIVRPNGELIDKKNMIPSSDKEALQYSKTALSQAWRSFIDYNPTCNVVVAATQLGEVLEIYNKSDSILLIGDKGEPAFRIQGSYAIPEGIMGFSDIQLTDTRIYAVFNGRTFDEMMISPEEIIDGGKHIYEFDLQGNPMCKYLLDRYINGIYVDEAAQMIYATDVNSDQPIIRFKM